MTDDAPPEASTFAERLDYLFRHVHPPEKAEYTHEEVAAGVSAAGEESISATYVWQLRKGHRTNPTLRHIEGLSNFFGVPPSYFLNPEVERSVNAQLDLLASLRDAGVRSLALRAHGLSAAGLAAMQNMVEHLRRMENLPAGEEDGALDLSDMPPGN
jgi:transcriptional regulator with XRE-family HTH domain